MVALFSVKNIIRKSKMLCRIILLLVLLLYILPKLAGLLSDIDKLDPKPRDQFQEKPLRVEIFEQNVSVT